MNFQNVNPLNIRLNKLSGNLLPMTSGDEAYPVKWRIYSAVLLLIKIIHTSAMIPALLLVPIPFIMENWIPVFVILTDATFLFSRLHLRRDLVCKFIREVDKLMRAGDETMRNIVTSLINPVQGPLKFYCIAGPLCIFGWFGNETLSVIGKKCFAYEDYRVPAVFSRQPFSIDIFWMGQILGALSTFFFFLRKIAVDAYMINILLLMTAQYRYTTAKLATMYRTQSCENRHDESQKTLYSSENASMKKMKVICRHHVAVIRLTPVLKELLSLNFSVIYLTNVFRFCFLGVMMIMEFLVVPLEQIEFAICSQHLSWLQYSIFFIKISTAPLDMVTVVVYCAGGVLQLYMVCSSVHKLLEASMQTTDEAFHEKWYQSEPQLKRMFSLMIIGNNLEMKLYKFGKYNLTLPSLMMILNQAYSIALLFVRMK